MRRLGIRVARVAGALPTPPPLPDWSRLTAAERTRLAQLQGRAAAVGLARLTDAEVAEGAALAARLAAPARAEG